MKNCYPIVISRGTQYFVVDIPDFTISTQGKDIAEAMEMARDAIGLMGIHLEDEGMAIPQPSPIGAIRKEDDADIVTLVDVDFSEYRRMNDSRVVKKNCTLPSWLNFAAEKAGVNFSAILQDALKRELRITEA